MKNKLIMFFQKPFFYEKKFIFSFWFIFTVIASVKHVFSRNVDNNYTIFKYVYYHTREQLNLYLPYPEYHDTNHYGPVFSLVIAPFTYLPDLLGCLFWGLFISFSLFFAVYKLDLPWDKRVPIFYIIILSLYTSIAGMQTNALIAAMIIGSFILIRKENDFWASCLIALGFMVKLYGIVGLCFFFFSKHKLKFIASLLFWLAVFFVLPMFISSPGFILQSYVDWADSLIMKNEENAQSLLQDISVMGMLRRLSGNREITNMVVLLPAMCLFALQYVRIKWYNNYVYQLSILASTLLFVVLFSSSSESQTYIIAMSGVAIWFVIQETPRRKYVLFLLFFALLITSFSSSDLIPRPGRLFIREYALKALPCLLVWLTLVFQLLTGKHVIDEDKLLKK